MPIYFDPFQQQAMQNQQSQQNAFMSILGNLVMQQISQKFREREYDLLMKSKEEELQQKVLSTGDWYPQGVLARPGEGEAPLAQMNIGGRIYERSARPTVVEEQGAKFVKTGEGWRQVQDPESKPPAHMNTSEGIVQWNPRTGWERTGMMPYQAPPQRSPYEGLEQLVMHDKKTGQTYIQWVPKGQNVTLDEGIGYGKAPADREPSFAEQAILSELGVPKEDWGKPLSPEMAKRFNDKKRQQNPLMDLLAPPARNQSAQPNSVDKPPWFSDEQWERMKQLEGKQ
jgi:hypothetical protein